MLCNLHGERSAECVDLGANSHLLTSLAAMPLLQSQHEPGECWLCAWVGGSGNPADDFPTAAEFSIEFESKGIACVLRGGIPWRSLSGSPTGESSAARRTLLAELA